MQSDINWSVLTEYLPPLLLTLRRWQHWWWGGPCPCSHGAGPLVHPGSRQRNHKLIYSPCLYFSLYMRLWSAKSERSPGCLAGPSHSLKHSSWVSNCSAWLSSLFRPGRGELPGWSVVWHIFPGELLLTSSLTGFYNPTVETKEAVHDFYCLLFSDWQTHYAQEKQRKE